MTHADFFCGIGGFRLGFKRAGLGECVYANDADPFACSIYRKHWNDGTLDERDIREVDPDDIPDFDIATAGWPCQDLSVAGKRAGLEGEQSGLFWELMRIVKAKQPRLLVLENVPGLLSSESGRDFTAVLSALDDLGYDAAWRVLNAQFFGVAQRRRRVFIVASVGGWPDPGEVLFEPDGGSGHPPALRKAGQDIAHALDGRSGGVRAKENQETLIIEGDSAASTPDLPRLRRGCGRGGETYVASTLRSGDGTQRQQGWDEQIVAEPDVAYPLTGSNQRLCANAQENFVTHILSSEGGDASEDGTGRGTPLAVALRGREAGNVPELSDQMPAMRSSDGGSDKPMVCADMVVRRLLPVECERLQGFPDGWTEGSSDSQRYKTIGNAVCVAVPEWIARRIKAAIEVQ